MGAIGAIEDSREHASHLKHKPALADQALGAMLTVYILTLTNLG